MTAKSVIHVGVDGAWRQSGALEWAMHEARLRQEPLRAVHVVEEGLRHAPYWQPAVVDSAGLELVKDVQQHLEADGSGLDHTMELVAGPPARTLTGLAADGHLLVLGRRGMGAFRRLLIGSTSEAVASAATTPVVVVPDEWKPADHAGPVLVAVDDSVHHPAALEFAVTAATLRKLPLRLVQVWDLPDIYSWDALDVTSISAEWAANAQRHVESVADQWRAKHPQLIIETEVRRGHPVDGVIAAAVDTDAQLLVVGGRKHHRVTSMVLGSVARGVLHHATCPVAVVHAPGDGS